MKKTLRKRMLLIAMSITVALSCMGCSGKTKSKEEISNSESFGQYNDSTEEIQIAIESEYFAKSKTYVKYFEIANVSAEKDGKYVVTAEGINLISIKKVDEEIEEIVSLEDIEENAGQIDNLAQQISDMEDLQNVQNGVSAGSVFLETENMTYDINSDGIVNPSDRDAIYWVLSNAPNLLYLDEEWIWVETNVFLEAINSVDSNYDIYLEYSEEESKWKIREFAEIATTTTQPVVTTVSTVTTLEGQTTTVPQGSTTTNNATTVTTTPTVGEEVTTTKPITITTTATNVTTTTTKQLTTTTTTTTKSSETTRISLDIFDYESPSGLIIGEDIMEKLIDAIYTFELQNSNWKIVYSEEPILYGIGVPDTLMVLSLEIPYVGYQLITVEDGLRVDPELEEFILPSHDMAYWDKEFAYTDLESRFIWENWWLVAYDSSGQQICEVFE